MTIPLNGYIVCNDAFQGPGGVAFDFKEYRFDPAFHTYDNSERSFARVIEAIKRIGIMEQGIYRWFPKHYGPLIIDKIEANDFVQIESRRLLQEIDDLVDGIQEQHFTGYGKTVDRQSIMDKIYFSLRLTPIDASIFFKYNIPIQSTNTGTTKVAAHNLFSYFHSVIGYNREKLYLLTLFSE